MGRSRGERIRNVGAKLRRRMVGFNLDTYGRKKWSISMSVLRNELIILERSVDKYRN